MRELQGKAFNARRTVLEMLYDRGYQVDSADLDLTFADFVTRFCGGGGADTAPDHDSLTYYTFSESDLTERVLVCFLDGPSLLDQFDLLDDVYLRLLVLVALDGSGLTYSDEPILRQLFRFRVERNRLRDAGLSGRHKIIWDEEMVEMLRDNHVNVRQVAPMQPLFYLARYYGLEKGDALEIKYDLPKSLLAEGVDTAVDNELPDNSDRIVVDLRKLQSELRRWPHILCHRVE